MDAPVHVGDVVAGRLRIVREIARGGMGALFEAEDTTLRRRVAIKVVLAELAKDVALRERLLREARAAAKLTSPHVAQVLEVGTLPGGLPFVVMELLEGRTVEDVLAREGPLSVDVALDWTRQALEGLALAHDAGLIHRDLKPSNLFVTRTPGGDVVKVLDFGIVRDSASTTNLTQTGESLGTPAYMSPEQFVAARDVGASADVWAMGVTLYEMLTGHLPFEAASIPELLRRVASGTPTPLTQWRTDIPEDLVDVVRRCLERDPVARFRDAREMREPIARILAARGPTLHELVPRPPTTRRRARPKKNPSLAIAVVAALTTIVIGGAAVVALVASRPRPAAPVGSAPPPTALSSPPTPAPLASIVAEAAAFDASVPTKLVGATTPPKPRCRCERRFEHRWRPLCLRYGPPYLCADGTLPLCLRPSRGECVKAIVDHATPGEPCDGFHHEIPNAGRWTAIGACVEDTVPPGSPSCVGRFAWDLPTTTGEVRCD